jgi:hypothetical protein
MLFLGSPKWPNAVVFSILLYYLKKEGEPASKVYGLKSEAVDIIQNLV